MICKQSRPTYKKECVYCKKEFVTKNKKARFCSGTCGSRYHADQIRGEYFCDYCGKPRYSDHPNRNRFCSHECARKYKQLKTEALRCEREKQRLEALNKICPHCGQRFTARQLNQKFCSEKCLYEYHLRAMRDNWAENYIPRVFKCKECGRQVTTTVRNTRSEFCSNQCAEKYEKKQYRQVRKQQMANAYAEDVSLQDIYSRAGGICEICGLPVPLTTEPSNEWAATVDHIKPLSCDGVHTNANCQLAHRICNSLKGQNGSDFKIQWEQKLKEDPQRWRDRIKKLANQINDMRISSPGAR